MTLPAVEKLILLLGIVVAFLVVVAYGFGCAPQVLQPAISAFSTP